MSLCATFYAHLSTCSFPSRASSLQWLSPNLCFICNCNWPHTELQPDGERGAPKTQYHTGRANLISFHMFLSYSYFHFYWISLRYSCGIGRRRLNSERTKWAGKWICVAQSFLTDLSLQTLSDKENNKLHYVSEAGKSTVWLILHIYARIVNKEQQI